MIIIRKEYIDKAITLTLNSSKMTINLTEMTSQKMLGILHVNFKGKYTIIKKQKANKDINNRT